MKTTPTYPQGSPSCSSVWSDAPAPDVWWGTDGIDALLWADPVPYENPLVPSAGKAPPVTGPDGDAS
jgi:hypothetical protein